MSAEPAPAAASLSDPLTPASQERLARQLQALSQLVESLTYRLLDLEERVAAQALQLQSLQAQAAAAGDGEETTLRLDDTEERLSQLEMLLNGLDTSALTAQPQPLDPPFPEEPEQLFMDEQEPAA